MSAPLSVGFDLDMTLIDTGPGFGATLQALGSELGVEFPVEEVVARLGPPLDQLIGPHLAADAVGPAVDRFRELYPDHAIAPTLLLPGAADALHAVRDAGGRVVVVTGKFTPNALLHLEHLDVAHDELAGEVWGAGKGDVLRREGCTIYVGDHVHDVEGARAAGALSVSVLTGGSTREELVAAGTDVVLDDLTGVRRLVRRPPARRPARRARRRPRERGSVMVAYSGGADSAFLLAAAVRALGPDRVVAATGYSDSLPQAERDPARSFAESLGVAVLTPQTHEMDREGYRANAGDRCFFCKAELLDVLTPLAREHGLAHVATGTNADDLGGRLPARDPRRPERDAITPLADAGLTKRQVRAASRRWALPTWDKPQAACLSSRIAYGLEVTPHRLARVERAEAAVRARAADLGVPVTQPAGARPRRPGLPRARRGAVAAARGHRGPAARRRPAAGFDQTELDPRGFRSGSLNDLL